jgi:thioredoxin-related protein
MKEMRLLIKIVFFISIVVIGSGFDKEDQSRFRLIVFEGSDWCAHCRRLEKEILNDSLFLSQLQTHSVVIERIDFPQRKKLSDTTRLYNNTIAEKYAFDGNFPTIILSRTDSFRYRKINYSNQSIAKFLAEINAVKSVLQ